MLEHLSWLLPAAKELYKDREDIGKAWNRMSAFLLGANRRIAFTGNGGAGKTVLHQHLSGEAGVNYQPPPLSRLIERGRLPSRRFRLSVTVIPGQSSLSSRLDGLDEAFGASPADGIVHVVCAGYTGLSRIGQETTILKPSTGSLAADLDSFRNGQIEAEVRGIAEVCERVRESVRRTGKPKWLLVAATKCDLFYDDLEQCRDFYLAGADSQFVACLRRLQNQVGSDNFSWSALPVCAWLEDYRWGE